MMATCANCGHQYDGSRDACPCCGSVGRAIGATFSDGIGISGAHEMVHHERSGPSGTLGSAQSEVTDSEQGHFEEGSVRHAHDADASEAIHVYRSDEQVAEGRAPRGEHVELEMTGPSPQNEEDTLRVARIFMERLIHDGYRCDSLRLVDDRDVDCELDVDGRIRHLQVTRAEQTLWGELAVAGHVQRKVPPKDPATRMRAAVQKKAKGLASAQRASLTLVLDATFAADAVLERVIECYRADHGEWTATLGFDEVWIVGPTREATYRLDPGRGAAHGSTA